MFTIIKNRALGVSFSKKFERIFMAPGVLFSKKFERIFRALGFLFRKS